MANAESIKYWQVEAAKIYFRYPQNRAKFDCSNRCVMLSKLMSQAGEKHSYVCGTYKGQMHDWLVKDGVIIDPSQIDTDPKWYKAMIKKEK
jgi:hypothetical protein